MTIKAVTINNVTYNVAQAPADKQKSLMLLIAGVVAMRSATSGIEEIDTKLLIGSLIMMSEDKFDKIANIALYKTVINGETMPIDVKSFQGRISEYFQLIAETVAYNLNDFFTYLDVDRADVRTAEREKTIQ